MHEDQSHLSSPSPVLPSKAGFLSASIVVSTVFLLFVAALFFFDPAESGFYPRCLFKKVTGYDCPGCGGLRAGHQLAHGRLVEAFQLNAMVVIALPLLIYWGLRRAFRSRPTQPPRRRRVPLWPWFLLATIVLFGLVRNLPFWPFGITPR